MIYKSDEELQAKCEEWQKRLRVQDWLVVAKIKRGRDMRLENCCGECEWNLSKKMASIRVLDPLDYPDNLITEQDMELTLIHELLHLHFAPFDTEKDEEKDVHIEQAIESISWGILQLYREKQPQAKKELKAV